MKVRMRTISIAVLLALSSVTSAPADSASDREYQIKAAFLYKFFGFIDWPQEIADSNEPVTIGVLGTSPFGKALERYNGKVIGKGKITIRRFKGLAALRGEAEDAAEKDAPLQHPELAALRKCRILFICRSEREELKNILEWVRECPVLTVGDTEGFVESGIIMNFVIREKKVRFEVNLVSAQKARLKIRAKLLRLAAKVVQPEPA